MQKVSYFLNNSSEALGTAAVDYLGCYVMYPTRVLKFNYPVLDYLNGYNVGLLYALTFAGATVLQY